MKVILSTQPVEQPVMKLPFIAQDLSHNTYLVYEKTEGKYRTIMLSSGILGEEDHVGREMAISKELLTPCQPGFTVSLSN